MESRAAISIAEIKSKYGIKQSAAYKWRTALRNLKLDESWENYDRINNREINLSGAVKGSSIAVVETAKIQAHNHAQEQPTVTAASAAAPAPMMDSGFGLSIGRLQELNSEAELEVLVKSKLKDFHESKLQSQRSQELKSRIEEVKIFDPKNLGEMLSGLGVA
jgi:transposase-like protein